ISRPAAHRKAPPRSWSSNMPLVHPSDTSCFQACIAPHYKHEATHCIDVLNHRPNRANSDRAQPQTNTQNEVEGATPDSVSTNSRAQAPINTLPPTRDRQIRSPPKPARPCLACSRAPASHMTHMEELPQPRCR